LVRLTGTPMSTLRIPTAPVFRPLLEPVRYKGAYGGRGSGKSHFFGELLVERCLVNPGTLAVCIREVQKSLLQSSKRLIEAKIQSLGVGGHFQVLHDRIVTPGDGLGGPDDCARRRALGRRLSACWVPPGRAFHRVA
jgi:phage terminase large subunit